MGSTGSKDDSSTSSPIIPFFFETNPPSPSATSSSTFFRFPREIRDLIYDWVFTNCRITCREGNLLLDTLYGPYSSDYRIRKLPAGLLACKRLLSEALEQFYREAQCLGYSWDPATHASSPYRLLSLYRIRALEVKSIGGRGNSLEFSREDKEAQRKEGRAVLVPEGIRLLSYKANAVHLCTYLENHAHSIKDITMRFDLPRGWKFDCAGVFERGGAAPREWVVDLSYLEKLGTSFDRVEFVIETPTLDMVTGVQLPRLALAYRVLQVSLEKLGRKLVGASRDEEGWSARDWCDTRMDVPVWHVEVQRAEGTASRNIKYEGMAGFGETRYTDDARRFVRMLGVAGEVEERLSFVCRDTGERVHVHVPVDGRIKSLGEEL